MSRSCTACERGCLIHLNFSTVFTVWDGEHKALWSSRRLEETCVRDERDPRRCAARVAGNEPVCGSRIAVRVYGEGLLTAALEVLEPPRK